MKLNKLLVVLGLLTSAAAMAAGTINSSVLGSSAQQSIDITFQSPLAVNHTLRANAAQFKAGKIATQVVLATGEVRVTAGVLRNGAPEERQSLAISPTHLSTEPENSGPEWIAGQAIGENNRNTFDFALGNSTDGGQISHLSVKEIQGQKWLVGKGDKLRYTVIVVPGKDIKPGKYNISVDAAVYTE